MASHVQGLTPKKKRPWKKPIPELTPGSHKKQTAQTSVTSLAPRGINVAEFAESRALEIHNMVEAITEADKSSRKRVFQQLPRHMRRRAMSHNVKRLPVRLREEAEVEMDKFPKQNDTKKKSRRHRRRPKNLLAEYTRRQRQHIWLETHIWHAKRMKMVDAWGYRLAEHPNDKGFRAVHRAVTNSCTIQDISYYGCIEISGPQSQIIEAMTYVTNQDAGPTIKGRHYLSGSREGLVVLYQVNKYPHGAVGPIGFLWRQNKPIDTQKETSGDANHPPAKKQRIDKGDSYQPEEELCFSQLWLWVHPACFKEAFDVIVEACKLVCLTDVKKDMSVDPQKPQETQDISEASPNLANISGENRSQTQLTSEGRINEKVHHICSNGKDTSVMLTVTSLRHDLVRFRLTGPQSHAILDSALVLQKCDELITNRKEVGERPSQDLSLVKGEGTNPKWWQMYGGDSIYKGLLHKQEELWSSLKKISSPAMLQSGCVLSLMVMDPRLNMPHKKTSVDLAVKEARSTCNGDADVSCEVPSLTRLLVQWPEGLAISPLWMSDIRAVVKETKISEHELNKKRSELLVPGTEPDLGDEASRIPIMLLQQVASNCSSGSHNSPRGYGAGWDIILPSGWAMPFWMALIYRGARAVGLKESRACAFEKFEPCFPRDFPDTAAGRAHNESLRMDGEEKFNKYPPAKRPNYHKLGTTSPFSCPFDHLVREWQKCNISSQSESIAVAANSSCEPDKALSNAVSEEGSHIKPTFPYVLRSKSILGHLRQACSAHKSKGVSKVQSGDSSPNTSLPDTSEHNHSLVCVSLRMLNRSAPLPCATIAIPTLDDLRTFNKNKNFSGPVEPLHKGSWEQLPKINLIGCCTREIIGYVTAGDYSLVRGGGAGLGFCIVRGLLKALALAGETSEFVVLVRNTNTQQYRFSSLDVV